MVKINYEGGQVANQNQNQDQKRTEPLQAKSAKVLCTVCCKQFQQINFAGGRDELRTPDCQQTPWSGKDPPLRVRGGGDREHRLAEGDFLSTLLNIVF